jgi:chromosome segregation ATPase
MSKELFKKAANALETLSNERDELENQVSGLQEKVAHLKSSAGLALRLLKLGQFPVEEFEDKFNEFSDKSADELKTFEKAAELMGSNSMKLGSSLGELSDELATPATAEDKFFHSLLEDY